MNVAISAAGVFGAFAVGNAVILMGSTLTQCSKTDFTNAFKNGAIAAAPCAIAYFLAAFFEFIRAPFVNLFLGFGVQDPMATNLGLGYIVMLLLWPMTVWAVHNSTTSTCVASVDEMSKFKTELLAKLKDKQHTQAAATTTKPAQ
jgi:hypothetical protein